MVGGNWSDCKAQPKSLFLGNGDAECRFPLGGKNFPAGARGEVGFLDNALNPLIPGFHPVEDWSSLMWEAVDHFASPRRPIAKTRCRPELENLANLVSMHVELLALVEENLP